MSLPESFFDECAELVEEHRREHEDPDRSARRRAERLGRPYVAPQNSPTKSEIKMSKSLTIELPDYIHQGLTERAEKAGTTAEEHAIGIITEALREIDGAPAKEIGEDDDSNETSKAKPRPPLPPTPAEAHATAMEIQGRIQSLICAGRFAEAHDLEKVYNACTKIEAKANQPSVEQQRQSLVHSIIKHGSELLRR